MSASAEEPTKPRRRQQEATTEEQLKGTRAKIREGLYHNKHISIDDLLLDPYGYDYDPEIINNINAPVIYVEELGRKCRSDWWYCYNCSWRGDKWFMMKHPCKGKKSQ